MGNAIISPCYYINYKNGGNTLPPVALPIGKFLLIVSVTSLPALFSSGGNLFSTPPNKPPKPAAGLISGKVPNDLPTVKLLT
jgi:hypothetical protein